MIRRSHRKGVLYWLRLYLWVIWDRLTHQT